MANPQLPTPYPHPLASPFPSESPRLDARSDSLKPASIKTEPLADLGPSNLASSLPPSRTFEYTSSFLPDAAKMDIDDLMQLEVAATLIFNLHHGAARPWPQDTSLSSSQPPPLSPSLSVSSLQPPRPATRFSESIAADSLLLFAMDADTNSIGKRLRQTDPLEYGYCPGQSSQSPGSSPSSGSTTPSPSPRPAHTAPFGLSAPSLSSSYEDYRFRFPEIKPEGKSFDPSTSDSEGEEAAFEFRAPNPGSAHSRSARPKPSLGHPHSRSASHTGKKHHPHPYQTPKVSSSCTEESAPSDTNLSVSPPKHPSLSSSPRFLGVPSSSPASMSPTLSQSSLSSASSQRRSRKMRTSKSSSSSLDEGSRRKGADSSPPKPAQAQRHCHYCMATQTPMWRHGPPEYPDLCNRCGVKYMRGRLISKKES